MQCETAIEVFMNTSPLILGIESSCDETALALVRSNGEIIAQTLYSQIQQHAPYGGVVPEIAARAHSEHIEPLARELFAQSGLALRDVDVVAATAGPGLIGGVIVGLMMGKAMAYAMQKPFYGINHLEGHALSPRLCADVPFPYLLFLMSGGHCQLVLVNNVGQYEIIGQTIDDAIGEAFDKCAKMMGLGYPGGPAIEAIAVNGDEKRFQFPRPYLRHESCDMSFSGLKTAVRTCLLERDAAGGVTAQDKADVAACLQRALCDIVVQRLEKAATLCLGRNIALSTLVVAGGVAANRSIRHHITMLSERLQIPFVAPPLALCTDNAAMIAWAAAERINAQLPANLLTIEPKPRWGLDMLSLKQN
jgi:N6-L-threonylcarbamoyladenine synthase